MLASLPYSPRSARAQASFAQELLCNENIEDALSIVSSMLASATHGYSFSSDLVLTHCNRTLCRQTEMVDDVDVSPEGFKKKLFHVSETRSQTSLYTNCPVVCSRDPRRRKPFCASVSVAAIFFKEKV